MFISDPLNSCSEKVRKVHTKTSTVDSCCDCLPAKFPNIFGTASLREKCPNTELFRVRIFLYSD